MSIKSWLNSIFGNDDEPEPPSWYVKKTPKYPDWYRKIVWLFFRNPLHNLFFYKWNIQSKTYTRVGDYPNHVFNPKGGWNRVTIILKDGKLKKFRSYNGDGFVKKFYIGYREKGNFGIKWVFNWRSLVKIIR